MRLVNYISNLDVDQSSGGWSGMNHHIYEELKKYYSVNLIDKIEPQYDPIGRLTSKLLRLLGARGKFVAFTSKRLKKIRDLVNEKLADNADFNFFHGVTPWLEVNNTKPYALYLDCCFKTYINIYHNSGNFENKQLDGIYCKEKEYLRKARAVFFSSQWALEDARRGYELECTNFYFAGLGGGFEAGSNIQVEPSKYFLFVGLDFHGKGGDKVVQAFSSVYKKFPSFKLKIVGEQPPDWVLNTPGIVYVGRIDKSQVEERHKLIDLFVNAYCFVMPTNRDMTPLVIVEALSVGCPVISMRSFGIPEIVVSGANGILLDPDKPVIEQLVDSMKLLASNFDLRKAYSEHGRRHIVDNFTWEKTGRIISDILSSGDVK